MHAPLRQNAFLWVVDTEGHRHAIRLSAITALSDADDEGTEAVIVLFGGRQAIKVRHGVVELFRELTGG